MIEAYNKAAPSSFRFIMRVIAAHVFVYTGCSSRDADDPEVAGRLVREDPCRIDAIRE